MTGIDSGGAENSTYIAPIIFKIVSFFYKQKVCHQDLKLKDAGSS